MGAKVREKESQAKGGGGGMGNMHARRNRTHFPCICIFGCIEKFICFRNNRRRSAKVFSDKTLI